MGGRPGAPFGGAFCRPRCTACILASISCETLRPLPRLDIVGGAVGRGFRAAFMFPSGVDEVVMDAAVAPDVDMERTLGRGGSSPCGGEALGEGMSGDGELRGASESKSSSGVEAMVGGGRWV